MENIFTKELSYQLIYGKVTLELLGSPLVSQAPGRSAHFYFIFFGNFCS